jgi:hypothetical protein
VLQECSTLVQEIREGLVQNSVHNFWQRYNYCFLLYEIIAMIATFLLRQLSIFRNYPLHEIYTWQSRGFDVMHYAKQEGWFCFFPVLPPVLPVNQSKGLVQFLGGGGRGDDRIERTYIVEGAQGHRGDRRR